MAVLAHNERLVDSSRWVVYGLCHRAARRKLHLALVHDFCYETGIDGAPILLPPEAVPNTLTYSFQDGQSSRNFSEVGVSMNNYNPNFPYYLSTPLMFLPNSVIRANISYLGGASTAVTPFITLMGYRLRIQGSENINSLVTSI